MYDFSTCLNAFGPADVVRAAAAFATIDEYPDPTSHRARDAAAKAWHIALERVAFGAGAAELVQATCLAFLEPGDCVVIERPAFGEYARSAAICGARIHDAWNDDELCGAIERDAPRLVFVCSPSNPLGRTRGVASIRELADICARHDTLLVLDQSYDAFTDVPEGTPLESAGDSVLHLRSLTKEHAIAGLRVGFAVGHPAVIGAIDATRVTWSASSVAQAAAEACFSRAAHAHVKTTVTVLRAESKRIRRALAAAGFEIEPSNAHFFVVGVRSGGEAAKLLLEHHGVLVRDCTSFGLPSHIRVASRTPVDNGVLIDALTDLSRTLLPSPT